MEILGLTLPALAAVLIAFAAGGILKGAIGAGVPIIVIPIMTLAQDVRFAVAVFVIPAFLSNLLQIWQFRGDLLPRRFLLKLFLAAGTGALIGSILLASLPAGLLTMALVGTTLTYVAFRLKNPGWVLPFARAEKIVFPIGGLAGILQGAAGISAPVSLTYINAMGLPRAGFIANVSVLFVAMASIQMPSLAALGLLTPERAAISLLACLPLFGAMPLGAWIGRRIPRETFDKIILVLLVIIALRLTWSVLAG